MGDRYTIQIRCAECGTSHEHWHAESAGSMSFKCSKCSKENWVYMEFVSRIVSDTELKELYKINGFE